MKLIIDIPEELAEEEHFYTEEELWKVIRAVENGTPLDSNSERSEVQVYFDGEAYGWEQGRKALIDDVKAEIDEQYDRIRPYNIDVAEGLEMALGILDNIGKESEDT